MEIENKRVSLQEIFEGFLKYKTYIIGQICRKFGNGIDYEDVFNEIIVQNAERIQDKFDCSLGASVSTYIFKGVNPMLVRYRRKTGKLKIVPFTDLLKYDSQFEPEEKTERKIQNQQLDKILFAIHNVPKIYKDIATGIISGMTIKEMAEFRNCSIQRIDQLKKTVLKIVCQKAKSENPPSGFAESFTIDMAGEGDFPILKKCVFCGKEFYADTLHYNKKYCSSECLKANTSAKQKMIYRRNKCKLN